MLLVLFAHYRNSIVALLGLAAAAVDILITFDFVPDTVADELGTDRYCFVQHFHAAPLILRSPVDLK